MRSLFSRRDSNAVRVSWQPQPDITLQEVVEILHLLLGDSEFLSFPTRKELVQRLPKNARRHLRISEPLESEEQTPSPSQ